jgi:myosin-crossreactive antigen
MDELKGSFNKSWGELIYKYLVAAFLKEENSLGKTGSRKCDLFLQSIK